MWSKVRLWWDEWRTEPELDDDDLGRSTRAVAKAIVQTLANRAYRRPELTTDEPLESAIRQRSFDQETLAVYREHIAPELVSIRAEHVARGSWTTGLEARYETPKRVSDLRSIAIELARIADE